MSEDFSVNYSNHISDVPRRKKQDDKAYEAELFSMFNPSKVVDAYEQAIGLETPSRIKEEKKILYKHILLKPEDEEDAALLTELLNDRDLYHITYMDKTWTHTGAYRLFLVYTIDLAVKATREKQGQTQHE